MSEIFHPICVKRILVSLDSSLHSYAALHIAVEIAHHYEAEIEGVFIKDITLLDLAELPFRQEVGEYSAIVREISIDGISSGINVQSRWIIRAFHKCVHQTNLKTNFKILRGKVLETIKQESEKCDLLILGKSGTNTLRREKLGSTAKAIINKQQKSLLLAEKENRLGYPMILFYDDSPVGMVSLETSRDLIDESEMLVILLRDDDPKYFEEKKKVINNWASNNQVKITIQNYNSRNFGRFLQKIDGLKEGLLILPAIQEEEKMVFIKQCLEKVSLPILLIFHPVTIETST